MSEISESTVHHVAKLSRIALSDSEVNTYAKHLSSIVHYVDTLAKVDVSNTKPLHQVNETMNVFRKDEVTNSSMRDELLACAPAHEDGFIKVKVVK